jgi:hypothetical protein
VTARWRASQRLIWVDRVIRWTLHASGAPIKARIGDVMLIWISVVGITLVRGGTQYHGLHSAFANSAWATGASAAYLVLVALSKIVHTPAALAADELGARIGAPALSDGNRARLTVRSQVSRRRAEWQHATE